MTVDLTPEELRMLVTAIKTWQNAPTAERGMSGLVRAMLARQRGLSEAQAMAEGEREGEEVKAEIEKRFNDSIPLLAKLVAAVKQDLLERDPTVRRE